MVDEKGRKEREFVLRGRNKEGREGG